MVEPLPVSVRLADYYSPHAPGLILVDVAEALGRYWILNLLLNGLHFFFVGRVRFRRVGLDDGADGLVLNETPLSPQVVVQGTVGH